MIKYFFLFSLILSSCETIGKSVVLDLQEIPPDKGIVLFSTGSNSTRPFNSTSLNLINGDSLKMYDKAAINIDYPSSSDIPNEHTNIRTLTLPEGKYYLRPKSISQLFIRNFPVFEFYVKKNEVIYIGHLYLTEDNLLLTNQHAQRDIQFFYGKNPKINNTPIKETLMTIYSNNSLAFPVSGILFGLP